MKIPNRAHYPNAAPVRPAVEERHLMDYVRVIYKRRWVVAPVFLIVLTIGTVNALRQIPIYQGRTQLLIEKDTPSVATLEQMFQANDSWFNDDFYQTQYRILQSRSLAKRTVEAMKLTATPPAAPKPPTGLVASVRHTLSGAMHSVTSRFSAPAPTPVPAEVPAADESAALAGRIDAFQGGVAIEPVRNSRLVDIVYTSPDAKFAAAAANALARAYIDQSMEFRFSTSKDAADFLGDRLSEQRKAVEASETALQAYREKYGAVAVADNASNIVIQRLTDLNSALTKAKTERINKEALYTQLKSAEAAGALETYPAVLSNEYVQKLRSELSDLQRQQLLLAERYGERHAEMIKIRATIAAAEAKLKGELGKIVQSVNNDYQASLGEERSLQSALDAQKTEALGLNRRGIELSVLQREADSNKQIYESLMQRTKETDISSERRVSNIRVVDVAEVPRSPISPNVRRSVMLSIVASLAMSLGLVFFIEYLDSRLKTPQDLKTHLGVPFLGMIPSVPKGQEVQNPLVTMPGLANFSEAFKTVRTNVLFSTAEDGARSLVVTSAGPGEGKSICSANLAVSLAQSGLRVLLVDADMRRPRVHEIFAVDQEPGFSNVLSGNAKVAEAIKKSPIQGLWLMTAGHIPPNPAELLGSPRYVDFLASLDEHFDWVVVDTPPVMVVADSLVVGNQATGVIFVVGADQTSRHTARNAVDQLTNTNANVIGSILNRADVHRNPHYYSQYYRKEYSKYYVK